MEGSSGAEKLLASLATHPDLDPDALRALLKATRLLGLSLGTQLAQYRNSGEPLQMAFADVRRLVLVAHGYETASRIHAERWQKVPERRRPHYTPHLRFQILELKSLLGLSQRETAQLFAISTNTVARWEQEVAANPGTETVGSLVRPTPPVRRYADVVRHLVQTMSSAGFAGCRQIAQTLARAGWRISKRSVGRIVKEKLHKTPIPPRAGNSARALRARYTNHIWMADVTTIPSLFRLFSFKLVVVLDVFSRMPLAAKVFWKEPSARQMGRLIQRAALRFCSPRHFVSDKGKQFTAKRFRKTLRRLGTRQRFGAVGKWLHRDHRETLENSQRRPATAFVQTANQTRASTPTRVGVLLLHLPETASGFGRGHSGRDPFRSRTRPSCRGPSSSSTTSRGSRPFAFWDRLSRSRSDAARADPESRLVSRPSVGQPNVVVCPEPRSQRRLLSKRSIRTAFRRCLDRKNDSDPPRQLPLRPYSGPN